LRLVVDVGGVRVVGEELPGIDSDYNRFNFFNPIQTKCLLLPPINFL